MGARSLIARMFGRDLPAPAPERVEPVIVRNAPLRQAGRRNGFAAAQWDRLTYDWGVTPQALDIFLRQGLRGLRARSRSLAINNDYMRQFLRRVRTNVIGAEGFSLQVAAEDSPGKPDEKANEKIKAEWDAFGKLGACTVCGRFSWTELQQLVITSLARDGEVLLREIRGYKNKWGYALQVLSVDQLDETLTRGTTDGQNEVRMGVEIDQFNRPVAYHLWRNNPADQASLGAQQRQEVIRVPASDIIHLYMVEDAGQTRGFPWGCSSMRRLQMLGGYEEAALVAARTGAAKMGFFTNRADGETPGPPMGERDPSDGSFIQDAEPGSFEVLPEGWDFKEWNPAYPTGEMLPFVKGMLRGAASGLGVSYNSLTSDLESVNYSSIRAGTVEDRDEWRAIQAYLRDHLGVRVFGTWLEQSLLANALGGLPLAKFDKFNRPVFQPRGWDWVDPKNDIEADALKIKLGLSSRTRIAAARGVDFDQIMREQAAEQKIAQKHGITLADPTAPQQPTGQSGAATQGANVND